MVIFSSLRNLDLLSVGISIAGILVIGFTTYFSNRKSITNRTFALFSIVVASWGLLNYINYQSDNQTLVLWTFRLIMFFSTWYTFMLFRLSYVFPNETKKFSNNYKFIINPRGIGLMIAFDINTNLSSKTIGIEKILISKLLSKGIIIQSINKGKTFRLLPNYLVSENEINYFFKVLNLSLKEIDHIIKCKKNE